MKEKFAKTMQFDTSSISLNLDEEEKKSQKFIDANHLIDNVNRLLAEVGIEAKAIDSFDELKRVAPSMFVAVYESLYHNRIDEIIRAPRTLADYERNAQVVIDHLSEQIHVDLAHITGKSIVEGNFESLSNLTHIFLRIVSLTTSNVSLSTIETYEFEEGEGQDHGEGERKDREDIFQHRYFPHYGHVHANLDQESISTKDSLLEMKAAISKRSLDHKRKGLRTSGPISNHRQSLPMHNNGYNNNNNNNRLKKRPNTRPLSPSFPLRRPASAPTTPTRRATSTTSTPQRGTRTKPQAWSAPASPEHHMALQYSAKHQQHIDTLFQEALHRIDQHKELAAKQQKASLQRQRLQSLKSMQSRQQNHTVWKQSQATLQSRWKKEQAAELKSTYLKTRNEESVTMKKLYEALYRQSVQSQVEAKKVDNEQLKLVRKEFQDQLHCVERWYKDRLDFVEENEAAITHSMVKSDYDGMLHDVMEQWEQSMRISTNSLQESMTRERQMKQDAWQSLLSNVDHKHWEDYLRVYPN